MITSVSDASPMITSVFDASPIRAGIISLPRCAGIYIKLKLVHSCSSLLSFTFKTNFLNFVQKKGKIFPDMEPKQ